MTARGAEIDGNKRNQDNISNTSDARYADGIAVYADNANITDRDI
jgi:hypothetical protein